LSIKIGHAQSRQLDNVTVTQSSLPQSKWLKAIQVLISAWLLFFVARTGIAQIHWPVVHDGAILSYIVFLIDHGMAPYRDIVEMSFPGSYMIYWGAIHLFGPSALGFRLFDYTLMAGAACAMMAITVPNRHWFGGVVGATSLFIAHASVSILDMAQRDLIMAVLLLSGCAFILEAIRRSRTLLILGGGFCFSLAAAIKPTALVFFLIPLAAILQWRKQGLSIWKYLGAGLVGVSIPAIAVVFFLLREDSFFAFFHILFRLDAVYAGLKAPSLQVMMLTLFRAAIPRLLLLLVALLWLGQANLRKSFEQQIVLLGVVLGATSFLIQHKGFGYHLYPFLVFVYLWIGIVLDETLQQKGAVRFLGGAALCFLAFWQLPRLAKAALQEGYSQDLLIALQADLTNVAAGNESGDVQCMEMTSGCINTLYRMKLVQTTGFIGDYYFFLPDTYPIVPELRSRFLDAVDKKRTRIIVFTDEQWPSTERGYMQIGKWPELAKYLSSNYHIAVERKTFSGLTPAGYRIYIRN
jgi:hypothetical protein